MTLPEIQSAAQSLFDAIETERQAVAKAAGNTGWLFCARGAAKTVIDQIAAHQAEQSRVEALPKSGGAEVPLSPIIPPQNTPPQI